MDDSTSLEVTAAAFRALGDPTRLRVVNLLAQGTCCVCEIREEIDVPGPLLSHHLGVLRDAGIIVAARRGRWIDYTLDQDALAGLVGTVTTVPMGTAR
jgi:ArsR family transcriptional regulator, arsenate/arsenite/antimonite-responsive transcriptional repressor